MFRLSTLTAKLVSVGSVILVLSLVWIGLTLWVTWQLEGGAAAGERGHGAELRVGGPRQGPRSPQARRAA